MMQPVAPQTLTLLIGLASVVGATVAVCLGHIDQSTYIAIVAAVGGVGLGAGVHAAGVNTSTSSGGTAGTSAGG